MKKVFLCAILASLSYPAIASSLQDQLSAVAEAEQQGKMKSKGSMTNGSRSATGNPAREATSRNACAAANKRAATAAANKKARQDKLDAEATADKNAIKVMKMSYAA